MSPESTDPASPPPAAAEEAGETKRKEKQDFSGDASQEYFVDGMTEALIADLAQMDQLHALVRGAAGR